MMGIVSFFWSRSFLLQPWLLLPLLWINVLGTIYGYEWYRSQLVFTWNELGAWLVWFVPDSPTASLFFSITLWYLIRDQRKQRNGMLAPAVPVGSLSIRGIWEALAVITQVKYGVWAVVIIFWGAALGNTITWQQWMLVVSHSCMALEALLYMRFYRFTVLAVAVGALWTLTNDAIDYTFGVFPWLPPQLNDQISHVQLLTVSLSVLGLMCALIGVYLARKKQV